MDRRFEIQIPINPIRIKSVLNSTFFDSDELDTNFWIRMTMDFMDTAAIVGFIELKWRVTWRSEWSRRSESSGAGILVFGQGFFVPERGF